VKQLWRTLLIIIASALVVGATWLLTPTTGAGPGRDGRRRPPEGQVRPARGESRGTGGINVFGVGELISHTALTGLIVLIVVGADKALARRGGQTAPLATEET
jgi:hypothetical protein